MRVACAGGGTGGHIYPGLAVAAEIRSLLAQKGEPCEIYWIGNKSGMDRQLVEQSLVSAGGPVDAFYGIPCGKLRRYLSLKNVADFFRFAAGIVRSFFLLKKLRPDCLFSKGGFVSVPPCIAARLLRIPYYTHECDCTPGLATKLNSRGAAAICISYEQTRGMFPAALQGRCIVTGNPVRPVFYEDNRESGRRFLGIAPDETRPVLLVLGGSLGARQINDLVTHERDWLTQRFVVVHQTGDLFAQENPLVMQSGDASYKPYAFIHAQMPSVVQAADVVLSRAGANSLWECAVCAKPMLLVPLCGSGTRGDQVDNARFFTSHGAALALVGDEATPQNMRQSLGRLLDPALRASLSQACVALCSQSEGRPSSTIARLVAKGGSQ